MDMVTYAALKKKIDEAIGTGGGSSGGSSSGGTACSNFMVNMIKNENGLTLDGVTYEDVLAAVDAGQNLVARVVVTSGDDDFLDGGIYFFSVCAYLTEEQVLAFMSQFLTNKMLMMAYDSIIMMPFD